MVHATEPVRLPSNTPRDKVLAQMEAIEREREAVLFPATTPHRSGFMPVSDGYSLYYEEYGNTRGQPVIVLHGGPGTGATAIHPRFFDPLYYRIFVFDQRGAGRSKPIGRLEDNTTKHLVGDIESLRRHLGIEKWWVFGTSWGSTLGLTYAITHPEACLGLALHGISLPRKDKIEWWTRGLRRFAPEQWQAFAEFIPEAERGDLLRAYYERLMHDAPAVHMPAAVSWITYEAGTSSLSPMKLSKASGKSDEQILGMARIGAHYLINGHFLEVDWFLASLGTLAHLPAFLSHGSCDLVCTPDNAYDLAQRLGTVKLSFALAGHSFREPKNAAAIVRTTEEIKAQNL
ncbi:prolyl aminopeptidase [Pelagibius sp.]|uniref:prolyl aminopeptidase n=1 Tax=Pelagibius sp. TaxID=1931238 RepID=UPI003B50F06B